ncbi:MAG: peptide chain release factor 1 [Planctomycetota bacterium]|jgi:peptide chain release factor 1
MGLNAILVDKLRERAERFRELEEALADPELVAQPKRFQEALKERGRLENAAALHARAVELVELRAEAEAVLAEAESDPDLAAIAEEDLAGLGVREEELEHEIKAELVADEDLERSKVVLEIRAGTGGDEATLFAADLLGMYQRFAESRRWKLEVIDATPSEVGGFKDITLGLAGDGVWNWLRFESGGHRVQRVPQTESQGRIHTSLATVAVLPEPEEVDLVIKDEDLRVDTMRAGGPGGQSVNTTASAVRITHLPTGTVVQCQDEKSQHKNKAQAMRVLRSRLFDAERQRIHSERAEARKGLVGSGDRSQRVRTYNFPQARVSDHRLSDNHSLEPVLSGRLGPLVEQLIEIDREERIRQL